MEFSRRVVGKVARELVDRKYCPMIEGLVRELTEAVKKDTAEIGILLSSVPEKLRPYMRGVTAVRDIWLSGYTRAFIDSLYGGNALRLVDHYLRVELGEEYAVTDQISRGGATSAFLPDEVNNLLNQLPRLLSEKEEKRKLLEKAIISSLKKDADGTKTEEKFRGVLPLLERAKAEEKKATADKNARKEEEIKRLTLDTDILEILSGGEVCC